MAISLRNKLLASLALGAVGCGGQLGSGGDAGADEFAEGNNLDGTANTCVSSTGHYAVCGGPNDCFADASSSSSSGTCEFCYAYQGELGVCQTADFPGVANGHAITTDGEVYVIPDQAFPDVWQGVPYDIGSLYANNGAGNIVRYADWSPWTGASLPTPTTCPTFSDFRVCGANCGGCVTGEACVGRSPNHPYGICVPDWPNIGKGSCDVGDNWTTCSAGQECFVFQSSMDGQALSDKYGFCLSTAACEDAKANYPGGAYCHVPQ